MVHASKCRLVAAVVACVVNGAPVLAEPETRHIPRATSPISVDGELDEPAWLDAFSAELAFEVQPGENVPAPVRTEVLVTHDETAVYFAFRAFDPDPSAIRAHLSERDNLGNDDWVGVILDTFNDQRRSFDLLVNPLGVQADLVETSEGDDGEEWDTIWDSAAAITAWGWAVEIRVPFSSLRFQASDGPQVWGFDAVRSYPRDVRHHIGLFARDRSLNCYLCQAISIEGFEGVSPGRNLEVAPTLVATRTDTLDVDAGDLQAGSTEPEAGVTARWGFTPAMSLTGTVNPDFSQVEADAVSLDVNRNFALFYPEKRPFFMEGADFFSNPLSLVYTRVVRDPAWGLKVTGKERGNTVGAYVVEDDITNLLIPGSEGSRATTLDQPSTATVLRYRRDFGDRFTVGAILTDRESEDYFNRLLSVDGDLRLSDTDRLLIQGAVSATRYPELVAKDFGQPRGDLEDWAMGIGYSHTTRTLNLWAGVRDFGADFRADLGFVPQVDYQRFHAGGDYSWYPTADTWYTRLNAEAGYRIYRDHEGQLLLEESWVGGTWEGPLQSHAYGTVRVAREGYDGVEFDLFEVYLHQCMKPTGAVSFFVNVTWGDQVDYANTRPGERVNVDPGLTLNLGRHLRLSLDHTWERMEVEAGRLYTANVSQLTATYQVNRRITARMILQNVDHDYAEKLYHDGRGSGARHLFTQALLSYVVNPRTVVYLGYSDNAVGIAQSDLVRTDRTIFLKLGYAWVM